MAPASTATRQRSTANAKNAAFVDSAVLDALTGHDELSLAQLREALDVGQGGPSESQLTRSLRALIANDQVTRPRRGFYAATSKNSPASASTPSGQAAATVKVPSPRKAISAESLPTKMRSKATSKSAAKKAAKPEPVSASEPAAAVDQELTAAPIARVLSAAPTRVRRVKRTPIAQIQPTVDPAANVAESSVKQQAEVAVAQTQSTVERGIGTDASLAAVAPLVDAPVSAPSEPDVEVIAEPVSVVPTMLAEPDPVAPPAPQVAAVNTPTPVLAKPAPAPDVPPVEISQIEAATDSERVWLRKAALPVAWFAITGLALMVAGAVLGGIIGIGLAVLAGWIYVKERNRQRDLDRIRAGVADNSAQNNDSEQLDALGVR